MVVKSVPFADNMLVIVRHFIYMYVVIFNFTDRMAINIIYYFGYLNTGQRSPSLSGSGKSVSSKKTLKSSRVCRIQRAEILSAFFAMNNLLSH